MLIRSEATRLLRLGLRVIENLKPPPCLYELASSISTDSNNRILDSCNREGPASSISILGVQTKAGVGSKFRLRSEARRACRGRSRKLPRTC